MIRVEFCKLTVLQLQRHLVRNIKLKRHVFYLLLIGNKLNNLRLESSLKMNPLDLLLWAPEVDSFWVKLYFPLLAYHFRNTHFRPSWLNNNDCIEWIWWQRRMLRDNQKTCGFPTVNSFFWVLSCKMLNWKSSCCVCHIAEECVIGIPAKRKKKKKWEA